MTLTLLEFFFQICTPHCLLQVENINLIGLLALTFGRKQGTWPWVVLVLFQSELATAAESSPSKYSS